MFKNLNPVKALEICSINSGLFLYGIFIIIGFGTFITLSSLIFVIFDIDWAVFRAILLSFAIWAIPTYLINTKEN